MSGHSKWATIKHKKGAADAKRGKLFAKLIKQVEVAARQGGGDVETNPTLRTMFQKARDNSVPLDTIERAVKRGTGELEGVNYEEIVYEGYGPNGVAILIDTLSDNRNRTGSEIRSLLTKNGGSMAEPGAVSWQFERKGILKVDRSTSEEDVMLAGIDHGAEEIQDLEDVWEVICDVNDVSSLRDALEESGIKVLEADIAMIPKNTVPLEDLSAAKTLMSLIDVLDDNEDVQDVHSNVDISDEIMSQL